MKKIFAAFLAVMIVASMATVASAETTTLTTTVPEATYVLSIPKDQSITYGLEENEIGVVEVTESSGFVGGKNLNVTLTYDAFKSDDVSTTIPFRVGYGFGSCESGSSLIFNGQQDGTVRQYHRAMDFSGKDSDAEAFYIYVMKEAWNKALPGDYTATITFTAEVVSE